MMYLNADSRLRVISISAMVGQLSDTVATWNKTAIGKDKELMKNLRTAGTWAQKALTQVFASLPPEELERCVKEAQSASYRLTYTQSLPQLAKEVNAFGLSAEEAFSLAEMAIELNCKTCNGKWCKDCETRDMLLRWAVPPYNEVTDEQHPCPYSYKEME